MQNDAPCIDYYQLFKDSHTVLVICSEHGDLISCNQTAERFFGLSANEFESRCLFDFISDDFSSAFRSMWDRCIRESSPASMESKIITSSKKVLDVQIHVQVNTGTRNVVVSIHDITQYKKQEDELHLFKLMVERTHDPMFLIDSMTAKMIYVNDAAAKHFGAP